MSHDSRLRLAGDIGGTKTALAVFSSENGPRHPLAQASFGIAGPVVQGRAQVTNLSWVADEHSLSQALDGVSVRLLNDLDAIAHAVPFLEPYDLETLNPGQPGEHGSLAVIAPGTGR